MWGHRNTGAHSPIWARDEICAYSRTQCFPDRAGGFADTLKPVNIQGWVRDPHVETEVPGTYLLETLGRHLNLRRQNQHRLAVFLFVELLIPVLLDTGSHCPELQSQCLAYLYISTHLSRRPGMLFACLFEEDEGSAVEAVSVCLHTSPRLIHPVTRLRPRKGLLWITETLPSLGKFQGL